MWQHFKTITGSKIDENGNFRPHDKARKNYFLWDCHCCSHSCLFAIRRNHDLPFLWGDTAEPESKTVLYLWRKMPEQYQWEARGRVTGQPVRVLWQGM